jgi:hypothetical protein
VTVAEILARHYAEREASRCKWIVYGPGCGASNLREFFRENHARQLCDRLNAEHGPETHRVASVG